MKTMDIVLCDDDRKYPTVEAEVFGDWAIHPIFVGEDASQEYRDGMRDIWNLTRVPSGIGVGVTKYYSYEQARRIVERLRCVAAPTLGHAVAHKEMIKTILHEEWTRLVDAQAVLL